MKDHGGRSLEGLARKKVLVVDDSKVSRVYISRALEEAGYDVVTANTAEEGLQLIPEVSPDLITSDVTMPGMDGYEFCERIRSDKDFSEVPIILVTSNDPIYSRARGFKVGAIDFISKPFEKEEIQYAVNKTLKPDNLFTQMKVLVADDSRMIRVMINQIILEVGAIPIQVSDGMEALEYLREHKAEVSLVVADNIMPHLNGIELCKHIRDEVLIHPDSPIIFLSAITDQEQVLTAFQNGATDYIFKPFFREELVARFKSHLGNFLGLLEKRKQFEAMEKKFALRNEEVMQTQEAAINLMGALSECRDQETGAHIKRTQEFIRILASEIVMRPEFAGKLDVQWIERVVAGAPLHDIGKIGVPDNILLKPGKLTDEEFEVMKQHAGFGQKVLSEASATLSFDNFLAEAAEIAGCHHEKWDGSGYPNGLKGEQIPLAARMMAIADVYDALTSKRVYKPAMSHEKAAEIIIEDKGKHFDPLLVDIFMSKLDEFERVRKQYPD